MGWNRASSISRKIIAGALLSLALAAGQTPAAHSQVSVSITNGIVSAIVGVSGTATGTQANLAGRFGVTDVALNGPLMDQVFSTTQQSYVTVRIDGGPPSPGADADTQTATGWDLIFGDVGSNAINGSTTNAKTNQGGWIVGQEPHVVGNTIVAKWQTLPGANPDTRFRIPPIEIDLTVTLVHDMVGYKFRIINRDNSSHSIGLRFAQDINKPVASTPDGPIYTSTVSPICTDTELAGSLVPPFWRGFYPNDSTVGGVIMGQAANTAITRPDRLTFGAPAEAGYPLWTFTPDTSVNLCVNPGDAQAGVYFSPRVFGANEDSDLTGRSIVTYYGKNHSTINFDGNFPAGIDAPFSVKFDPSKPVGQQFTPNPMTVVGFVFNTKATALQNVTAVISLPPGLALASSETGTKSIGSVAAGAEGQASWQVVPTGTATGTQRIAVSFSATPGAQGTSVTRDIELPALPSHDFLAGVQMVSFPFTFNDATPTAALGLSSIDFDLLQWNPLQGAYQAVDRIDPGQGYWLRLSSARTVNLQGTQPVTVSTTPFEIPLKSGWNQIGDPYLYSVRWADVQVISTDTNDPNALQPVSILDADSRGWVSATIYSYDPSTGEYVFGSDLSDPANTLVPFKGYWVRAFRDNLSLLVPPTNGRAAKLNMKVRTRSAALTVPGGWALRIAANGEHSQDTWNYIGLSSKAADGADRYDIEKPPAIQGAVRVGILHPNWGRRAGVYAADIQAAGGRKQWDVVLTSPTANENVTLSWPDISRLPKGYELYITDKATGERKLMRQTPSIRVNTGAASSRAFTITAEPRSPGNALMLNASVIGGGRALGVAKINVNSNLDATFTVRVLGASGQTVRQIASGRAAAAGKDTTVIWDGKDSRGVSVPSGTYNIEVKGVTPDGQTAKRIVPHTIVR